MLDGYQGTLVVRCALRFAPLVFARSGELRKAQRSDIDLESAEWRYTVTKTGIPHIVPLSRQAVEILRELHPLTGQGRYVFPSARTPNGDRPMSENAVLAALRRMGIGKKEMTGPMGFGRWRERSWMRCWDFVLTPSSISWPTRCGTPMGGPTTARPICRNGER